MYDEKLIEDFLPTIYKLAEEHQKDYIDIDELYSEGLLAITEYLNSNNDCDMYTFVQNRMMNYSNNVDEDRCLIDVDLCYTDIIYINLHNLYDVLKKVLTPREHDIINRTYGLFGPSETYTNIAKDYHVTIERIRQLVNSSINKVKTYLIENNIYNIRDFSERI